jgi:hypothetical protein
MPATGHFAPVRLFMMSYVLLWACLSCVAAQNDATTLQTSQSDCCDVLTELHKFVRERDENDCSTDVTGNCHLLPIMLEFRNRTNMLLESTTSYESTDPVLCFPYQQRTSIFISFWSTHSWVESYTRNRANQPTTTRING